ncbi:hypothetical protein FNP15_001598 [Enterococcus faecalis]|uniref:hypothetical protein n=1 Tax=Enterococcus faecalis TaxID=1351 RepID=UPI001925FB4E|nr:hypothetical protein [Enterococcus faecalis]EGO7724988.1 hypothetical protein [Enterococcus faecalis]EGO7759165.1 hypothetical protein [Enterococcus faecalis]EGO8072721.1 hypothetical protein [Enterococcus faecalis]EHM3168255.1 hypothetical protein [Enterococcus faecalis]EJM6101108.1 hypothetical protein [Enterococcus faecalis]
MNNSYIKVIFSKIFLSVIIAVFPLQHSQSSTLGKIFLSYLAFSIIYFCFAISKNYLITLILLILVIAGFTYLNDLSQQKRIPAFISQYLIIGVILTPFIYDSYIIICLILDKVKSHKY